MRLCALLAAGCGDFLEDSVRDRHSMEKSGRTRCRVRLLQRTAYLLEALRYARMAVQCAHTCTERIARAFSRTVGCRGSAVGLIWTSGGVCCTRSLRRAVVMGSTVLSLVTRRDTYIRRSRAHTTTTKFDFCAPAPWDL